MEGLISIIIPVFNSEQYLETCLKSLLNQTYKKIEIIFVDDCSTDHSLDLLRAYENDYPGLVKVIELNEKMLPGGARNIGIINSTGEFISFMDSDDAVHPLMYEELYNKIEATQADVSYCGYMQIEQNWTLCENRCESIQMPYGLQEIDGVELTQNGRSLLVSSDLYGSVCGGLYRAALIKEKALLFPEKIYYEDNYWAYIYMLSINKASFVPYKYYYYRYVPSSVSHSRNALYHYDRIRIAEDFLKYVNEKGLLHDYYEAVEYIYLKVHIYNTYYTIIRLVDRPSCERLNVVRKLLPDNFPNWNKNHLFITNFSRFQKLRVYIMTFLSPNVVIPLGKIYLKISKKIIS